MYLGKNIRLRAPERTDIPRFVEWVNDPEVREGLKITYPMSLEDETRWFDHMLQEPLEMHPLVIETKEGKNWVSIGSCGFHDIDWRNANAEIGILIGEKKYWDKGLGGEVLLLMLKVGFDVLNLHRIWLRVHDDNLRAIKCYQKVGFVIEGHKRQAEFKNGNYIDIVVMSVLRPEWKDDYHPGV